MSTPNKLRPYQVEAVERALKYDGFGLFMEQRTGKTDVACTIVQQRAPERLLVACPKIAIDTVWWKTLHEYDLPNTETRVVSYESLWRDRRRLKRWAPDFVIADELHRIKERRSKQSRALRSIAARSRWRLGLTGTPLEGHIVDAWAQMDFVDPRVFGPWQEFKGRYLVYGGFKGHQIIRTQNEDDFERRWRSRFFRVLLSEVQEVPTEIEPPVVIEFDLEESRPFYEEMQDRLMVELDGRRIVAPRVITQILKMHQLAGGFILDEKKVPRRVGDEKLTHCAALILHLARPVVVFVRFIFEMERLARLCRVLGLSVTRVSGEHKFEKFDTDVAIVQIRAGIAIDLSRAEDAIFYSWGYSYLDFDQARFRVRSFHSKRVRYYFLVARETVDEDLLQAVESKEKLTQVVVNKYSNKRR